MRPVMVLLWIVTQLSITGQIFARNCDAFFYAGAPMEIIRYDVSFIKKHIPDIYLIQLPGPISKSSDVAIEWSKQAVDCLLNPKNGVLAGFDDTKTLNRMLVIKRSFDDLSTPYENDTLFETRRINKALKENLEELKVSVKATEPPKIRYLRGILTQSCGSFESLTTNIGIITALGLPIELRKNYIRDFCGKDQEISRTETLKKLEEIALQCNDGNTEACDLKDVFDSVDCSRVDTFLNHDFNGLIARFESLGAKVKDTRKICGDNIGTMIDTCLQLDLGNNACLIPATEVAACQRLDINSKYCAK